MPVLIKIIENNTDDLTEYARNSMETIMDYLKVRTEVRKSSEMQKDNSLTGQDRIIEICRYLCADTYINPAGGRALYQKEKFAEYGIGLYFLDTRFDKVMYRQYDGGFANKLSVIDVLMFNSVGTVREFLEEYELNM